MYSNLSHKKAAPIAQKSWLFFTILCGLMLALIAPNAMADTPRAEASVSKTQLTTNEVFNLRVVYNAAAHREDFDTSALTNDFTTGSVQFGTSRYIINGDSSVTSEWNISLATNKTGQVTIPSFEIDGVKTTPITLQVTNDPSAKTEQDLVAFEDSISKTTLYPKESATFVSKLLVKTDPRGLQNPDLTPPSGSGLNLKPMGDASQYQQVINGIETTVVEQKYQVSADHAGTFSITPARFQSQVISISRSGSRRIVPVDIQSQPITIEVKDKPTDYQGAWLPTQSLTLTQGWQDSEGNMLETSTGSIDVKVGQPITRILALTVQDVSAENLPEIQVDYPASIRVYGEKPKFGQDKNGDTLMTLKQVLIPKQAGKITLPEVTVPWWNSKLGQAQTATARALTLNTTVDENAAVASKPATSEPAVTDASSEQTNSKSAQSDTVKADSEKVATSEAQVTAGYWPYLTALFAALWIVTLLLLIKQRKSPTPTVQTSTTSAKNGADAFQNAIKSKDGVKVQSEWHKWQAEHPNLANDVKKNIQTEINALMASLYGTQQQEYDVQPLLNLIKQAEKSYKKTRQQDDGIAKL
ncbi:MAG: BatD family protein [Vibrio sp.]